MKKMMTVLAACAVTSLALADSGVVSQNTVGYATLATPANTYRMIGFNLQSVGSTNGLTIDAINPSGKWTNGDKILTYANNYTTYYYRDQTYLTDNEVAGSPGWYSGFDLPVGSTVIPRGTSVWGYFAAATNVTIAGEVSATTSTIMNFPAGKYVMAASAYPVPFNPNSLTWTGLTNGDKMLTFASNYTTYFYRDQTYLDDNEIGGSPGWYTGFDIYVASPVAGIEAGFWVISAGAASVTQPSPL